jgi:hypothetical protein
MVRRQQSVKIGVVDVTLAQVGSSRTSERFVSSFIHECIKEIALIFGKWHVESTPHPLRLVYRPLLFDRLSRTPRKVGLHWLEGIPASSC